MIFNEALEQRQAYEEGLLKKWDKALNADGGIGNEHMAKTTAILLENYMQHLQSNPSLIAEERISTNNFKGVNLALLGLIRRAIPTLVGAELVGIQAMPTPQSPIFYMAYKKAHTKGNSTRGEELFGYPSTISDAGVLSGSDANIAQIDPFYSSDNIKYKKLNKSSQGSLVYTGSFNSYAGQIVSGTVRVICVSKTTQSIIGTIRWPQTYAPTGGTAINPSSTGGASGFNATVTNHELDIAGASTNAQTGYDSFVYDVSITASSDSNVLGDTPDTEYYEYYVAAEYTQESNNAIPELEMQILQYTISLVRRQLRGKFSLDAAVDAKAYHGISLENELMEMMKLQLTNEINREIINDLRYMSGKIYKSINYANSTTNNVTGNYDDTHKLVLDAINGLSAEIYNQTRVGRGNFVVGNPVTLAFLDRVPGFVGSGVDMSSGGLSYAGKQGGRMSFYFDPQYPKNELLIGYKGASALDCGYIHAPYLPITSTPTLYNQETGDPSKIFYTRYGKTFKDYDADTGKPFNAIYRGEYFYAKLFLESFPTLSNLG
jgi:hypothetical protein